MLMSESTVGIYTQRGSGSRERGQRVKSRSYDSYSRLAASFEIIVRFWLRRRISFALPVGWWRDAEELIHERLEFLADCVACGYMRPNVQAEHDNEENSKRPFHGGNAITGRVASKSNV